MSRVLALIATIPSRRVSCCRLLAELNRQKRKVDGVVLVLDGYGTLPTPESPLPIVAEYRTEKLSGPGARWRVAADLPPEDILVCLDDDIVTFEAPNLVKGLVAALEASGGAAAAMGRGTDKKRAPPQERGRGLLMYAAGCGLTVRAKHLIGLQEFAASVQAAGGPDMLGLNGDDDALVSAFLWKNKIPIQHASTGNIYAARGTHTSSQTKAKLANNVNIDAQKMAVGRITGWPWTAR